MPFLGYTPDNTFHTLSKQTITGDGGTSYTLANPVVGSNDIEVFVNNVRQEPGVAYTATGVSLSFTSAVQSSDDIYIVYQGKAVGLNTVPDNTISAGKIVDGAVTTDKLASGITLTGIDSSSTVNDGVSNVEIGYRNIPIITSTTVGTGSVGKCHSVSGTVTVPNSTMSAGDEVSIFNTSDSDIELLLNVDTTYINNKSFTLSNKAIIRPFDLTKVFFISPTSCLLTNVIEPFYKGELTKGFFSGGYAGSNVTSADRTTYSTETTAAVSGANLSQARRELGAAGNADKGFFSGGYTGSVVATADRTTYATETTAAVSGANLSQARRELGAAGNADKGFFSGGYTGSVVATADRTTYSTETTSAVSGANLSQARRGLAAAGNTEKGFFSGGYTGSYLATADRTTYATETTAAVSGANLSQARGYLAAAGNTEKGFFSGGYTGSRVATADRTTYSTETTAAVSGANLSQVRNALAAAGNSDKGFFSGGYTTGNVATADRTTYSTETTAAVSGANLSQARYYLAAA